MGTTLATFPIEPGDWNGIGPEAEASWPLEWRVELFEGRGVFATLYRQEPGEPLSGCIYWWAPMVGESCGFSDAPTAMRYALDRAGWLHAVNGGQS